MSSPSHASAEDWLAACRRATEGLRTMLGAVGDDERLAATGQRGAGGDRTLMIDARAEEIVFAELEALHGGGAEFRVVSEERGEVGFGNGELVVVVDPIDGSTNAKRGLAPYALSVAVADGPLMSDVLYGYVYDLAAGEEWWAARGEGAWRGGAALSGTAGADAERRTQRGLLELVAIESADPRWIAGAAGPLQDVAHRVRALGSIAVALCQVAAGRVDGMATLWRCRAVDAAAAQLIVREAGGLVRFTAFEDPLGAPLDLTPHSPVVAGHTERGMRELAALTQPTA